MKKILTDRLFYKTNGVTKSNRLSSLKHCSCHHESISNASTATTKHTDNTPQKHLEKILHNDCGISEESMKAIIESVKRIVLTLN